jgi:putative heme-binding domain-containing protein
MRRTAGNWKIKLTGAMGSALTVIVTISASPRQPSGPQQEQLKDPQVIAEGARLFAPNCGSGYCHGVGGTGGGGPRLRGKGLDASYLFKTISNGVPGTPMLSFKSQFTEQQIWKLVAYIMSDSKADSVSAAAQREKRESATSAASGATASLVTGDAQAGRTLFFDSARSEHCAACHSVRGEGGPVGPDLARVGGLSAKALFQSIIMPGSLKEARYAAVTVTLRSGDKITGVRKDEDSDSIRVYDVTELPAVLRTVQRSDIADLKIASESIMPKTYATIYTVKQLLDIVTFLKSLDAPSKPIGLSELFE